MNYQQALLHLQRAHQENLVETKPDPAIPFVSASPASMREEAVKLFKEIREILDKFSTLVIALLAAKNTDTGANPLFKKLKVFLVLIIVVHYLTWVVGTILVQLHGQNTHLLPILTFTTVLLGCSTALLALAIISPTISFITMGLWAFMILTLVAYCYHREVSELISAVPEKIKNWIETARSSTSSSN